MSRLLHTVFPPRLGRPFARVVGASWVTNLGDGIGLAAAPLLVASQTSDPLLVSLAPMLQRLPWLLFGLPAGAIADRVDRRLLIVGANLARTLLLAVLVAFLAAGQVSIAVVLVVTFFFGVAECLADTTASTLTPMLVARRDLGVANARLMAGRVTLNDFAGPPVGAALFAAGMVWPFVAQTLCVLAGALLVLGLHLPAHGIPGGERTHLRADIAEGLRWLWHNPPMRVLTTVILTFNITWGAAWSILVLYSTDHLDMGEVGFGLLTSAGAVGGVAGIASYRWFEQHVSLGTLMKGCLVAECVMHVAFAVNRWPWGALVIMFGFGFYAFIWGTLSSAVRQRAVPQAFQGRVASVYLVGVFAGIVVGTPIGGLLARHWGITAPFWFAGIGSILILAVLWRRLELIVHADQVATEGS